ncbi:MAG: GEVED domain-containing protein [Crocinitomicaceae bacterium]|nr:GEVED domain-containing protein [Crocinitomicaceae bacterium]
MKKLLLLVVAAFGGFVAWGQCLPTYNSQCTSGDFINGVVFNTISNTGTGCTNPGTNNYTDYTAISTNVQQNTSYTIDVSSGPSWGQYHAAFIDFNQDGDFDDAGEFFDVGYAAAGATASNTILIPNGIPGGPTIMRVICKYNTTPITAGQACNNFSYGECEEYTLNIASPLTDDAGIAQFVTPTLPTCSFTDSVRVELYNYGTDSLFSADIAFTINAGIPSITNWTGAIAPFSSETVNLGLFPLASGDNLVAIASNPNGVTEDPAGAWNDFADIASLEAGLSGTYTIGGTTPDYADFATALSDAATFGLCGSVVFDVRDGIYNEQLDLTGIPADSTNTLTIKSENADASLVTVTYASTGTADNYIVRMSDNDYVTFLDLTMENTGTIYGHVLEITGGSDYNHFENCHFHTVTSTGTSTNTAILYSNNSRDNWNSFINNIFEGGSYGGYWYGAGIAATDLEEGTVFDGNVFVDNYYYGLRCERQDAPVLNGNSFMGESTYTGSRFALYLNYNDNGFTCTNNVIKGDENGNGSWRYGVYALNNDGTNVNHANLSNNMVQVGQAGSTATFYGIYTSNSGYIDIAHNSVFISEGGTSSRAYYGTSGGGNTLKNNMFVNYTAGYAIYLASNYTIVEADNNLYHSPSGNVGYFANTNQATLADWQAAFGADANSVDMDPLFHSLYDLHVCNEMAGGLGTPLANITTDIDGQGRDAVAPDMGADEFSSLSGNFLGSDVEVCTGDVFTLSAGSPNDTILWSTGDTTTSIDASAPGTYYVDIISVCGTGSDTIIVSASADVYTDFLVADTLEFCAGGSALLYSNAAYDSYSWTGGSSNDSLTVTAGGTYTLDVTDACGTGTQSVTVTENDVPVADYTWTASYVTGLFTNTTTSAGSGATYAWDFGDGVGTSTDENPSYVYSAAGTYYVTVTVTNACGTDTYGDSVLVTTVGLEEIAGLGTIAVYPNPSNGIFNLDVNFNEAANLNLVVVDMLGKEVAVKQINAANGIHSDVIDLSTSATGVYFLKVISDNNTISTQVLVKK